MKWEAMGADSERSKPLSPSSLSKRRKPLSDSTNLVVPTSSVLRKLSYSLSTPPPLSNPIQKPKPSSNANTKPYNSSKIKPGTTNSSKSDTSIGSSNYNHNNASIPKTPPRVSVIHSGNGSGEVFEPVTVYNRRETAVKIKDKGKAIDVPRTRSFLRKTNGNENSDAVPFTSPPLQKTKDKGKAVGVPFNGSLLNKRRDKGKAIDVPLISPNLGKTNDNGKAVSVPIAFPSLVNTRNKRKAINVPFSCPPMPRTKKIRSEFNEVGDGGVSKSCTVPRPKTKKKRHCSLQEQGVSAHDLPQEFIELQRAYFKDVDEFELAEEEISESELDNEEDDKKCFKHDEVGTP